MLITHRVPHSFAVAVRSPVVVDQVRMALSLGPEVELLFRSPAMDELAVAYTLAKFVKHQNDISTDEHSIPTHVVAAFKECEGVEYTGMNFSTRVCPTLQVF